MAERLVAVGVPIYKSSPDAGELVSLNQCIRVLGRHPVIFFAPERLDMTFYENHCKDKINFQVLRFDSAYFDGIKGYNSLMLSPQFYQSFLSYRYLLIYQLDAYVFRDELEAWCRKGYDYIGAPYIFVDLDTYPIKVFTKYRKLLKFLNRLCLVRYRFRHVGNGGFSLRHVRHTIRFLTLLKRFVKKWPLNEDSFFTHFGNLFFLLYKIAPEKEALQFSFEEKPDQAFKINDNTLPFGCHAYARYNDNGFWDDKINP